MTLKDIEDVLWACWRVKFPREIRHGKPSENGGGPVQLTNREKVAALEDYMLLCAEGRSHAEEARLAAHDAMRTLRGEWDGIEGWEVNFKGSASKATGPQIDAAKAKTRPDLWPNVQKAEWLVKRLSEQVARFKQDEETTSRLYTFITGG